MLDGPWKYVGMIVKEVNFEQNQNWKISVSLPLHVVRVCVGGGASVTAFQQSAGSKALSHRLRPALRVSQWSGDKSLSPLHLSRPVLWKRWEWNQVWWRSHCWTSTLYLSVLNPMLCLLWPLPLPIHFVSLWNHCHVPPFSAFRNSYHHFICSSCSLSLCPSSTLNRTSCPSYSWLVAFWKW